MHKETNGMKKSTLLTIVALVLALAMGVSGTMAYLSDTDDDVNVMTLGNVDIEQIELERVPQEGHEATNDAWVSTGETDKYGHTPDEMQDFNQSKPLYPAVFADGQIKWDDRTDGHEQSWQNVVSEAGNPAPGASKLFDDSVKNAVDKFVFVENTGKSDAYVRTVIAFEQGSLTSEGFDKVIATNGDAMHWNWETVATDVVIDGNEYVIAVATYMGPTTEPTGILAPGAVTYPSLLQVYMLPEATNEDCIAIDGNENGTYDILVVSQAVQTAGFANAEAALNAAFGEVSATSHPWMAETENGAQPPYIDSPVFPGMVTNNEELATAIAEAVNAEGETEIRLASGTYEEPIRIPGGSDLTIVGNGAKTVINDQIATTSSEEGVITLKNLTINVDNVTDQTGISQTGKSGIAIWGNQTVICENVTFNMTQANSTAITSWWDTGVGTTIIVKDCTFNCNGQRPIRATGNVTVENCTFNDPYRYAVQLTAKTSTATLMDKAIINFNNNTIVDGPNGKDFVYGIQLEGADYGCNNCVINGAGNKIVNGGAGSTMYYCECGKVQHETITFNTEVDPVHEN